MSTTSTFLSDHMEERPNRDVRHVFLADALTAAVRSVIGDATRAVWIHPETAPIDEQDSDGYVPDVAAGLETAPFRHRLEVTRAVLVVEILSTGESPARKRICYEARDVCDELWEVDYLRLVRPDLRILRRIDDGWRDDGHRSEALRASVSVVRDGEGFRVDVGR